MPTAMFRSEGRRESGGSDITGDPDDLTAFSSYPSAVMKMLMRTVKKTSTVATLFILFNLACLLSSFRSYFTAGTESHNSKT